MKSFYKLEYGYFEVGIKVKIVQNNDSYGYDIENFERCEYYIR